MRLVRCLISFDAEGSSAHRNKDVLVELIPSPFPHSPPQLLFFACHIESHPFIFPLTPDLIRRSYIRDKVPGVLQKRNQILGPNFFERRMNLTRGPRFTSSVSLTTAGVVFSNLFQRSFYFLCKTVLFIRNPRHHFFSDGTCTKKACKTFVLIS